jgi:hypothetical protein
VKERQAYQLGYETFTDTMQTANAEQGRNWRKMVRQAARETRYLERHGVSRGDTAAMMGAKPPTDNETNTVPKQ